MADVEIEDRGTALLPGVHRVVRALDPTEGPFAGTLVTRGDAVAVRVDAASLAGWVGWRFAGAEHVAGPVDVIRRADGHDVLLPWCTDRVLGFLVRRTAADSALSSGECSTLVVSLLRGLDELGESADAVQTGVWWLTDGGRPTFVIGAGEDPRAGAAEIVARLREECVDKALGRVLTTIEEGLVKGLRQPRVPRRSLEDWEQELLATAAPRPLRREVHPPERARGAVGAVAPLDLAHSRGSSRRHHRLPSDRRRGAVLFARNSDLPRRLRSVVEQARIRVSTRSDGRTGKAKTPKTPPEGVGARSGRRRMVVFAGAAAIAVLVGGLLWPTGDRAESTDAAESAVASPEPTGASTAPADEVPRAAEGGEEAEQGPRASAAPGGPVASATALLKVIAACDAADDQLCADAVAPGSVGVVDTVAAVADTSTIELVDEYGDVAVVRLSVPPVSSDEEAESGAESSDRMLVLARHNEDWLVRDVYGVADQPD